MQRSAVNGSGPKGSSHKQYRSCAVGSPVALRGDRVSGHFFPSPPDNPYNAGRMKRLFIVANTNKPHVAAALEQLRPWLDGRAALAGLETDSHVDLASVEADLILVLGGGGPPLSAPPRAPG